MILVFFFSHFFLIYDFNQINELFKLKTSGCDLSPPVEKVSLVKKTFPKIETVSQTIQNGQAKPTEKTAAAKWALRRKEKPDAAEGRAFSWCFFFSLCDGTCHIALAMIQRGSTNRAISA